eukprot:231568-Hanusia_phi.AAC.2
MVPFSHHVGELRAHYAGFFDPGFGYGREGEVKGTVGVLEVGGRATCLVEMKIADICNQSDWRNAGSTSRNHQHLRWATDLPDGVLQEFERSANSLRSSTYLSLMVLLTSMSVIQRFLTSILLTHKQISRNTSWGTKGCARLDDHTNQKQEKQ